jgi:hypothetical protein
MSTPKCVYNYNQLRNVAPPPSLPGPPGPPGIHLPPCDYVFVSGFPDPENNGLQGFFEWRPNSSADDNGGTVIKPNAVAAQSKGRWHRVFDGAISVKWFGAKGDGVANDSTAIRNALNAAAGKTVYVPSGAYNIASTLLPPANTRLVGDGYKGNSLLVATSDVVMIKLNNPRVTLESLDFDCTNQTVQPAIWLNSSELSICCCRLLNVALYGIYASGSASDVSIVSNRFTGRSPVLVPSYGVSFDYSQGAEAVLTQGNYFTYFEVGIRSYGITGSAHIHNIIEAGATGFWVLDARNAYIDNCFESLTGQAYLLDQGANALIIGSRWQDANLANRIVYSGGSNPSNTVVLNTEGDASQIPRLVNTVGVSATELSAANLRGTAVLKTGSTSAIVQFSTPEPDAAYFISLTPTGPPSVKGANRITSVTKSAGQFSFTVEAPPTLTTYFDWHLLR